MERTHEPKMETEAERAGLKSVAHEATRFDTGCRLDLLDPDFLDAMGHIMYVGAVKYGEDNWKKGLPGEKSGHNHAMKHLLEFRQGVKNDYGPPEMHYAQVAINAMFQYFEVRKERLKKEAESRVENIFTRNPKEEKNPIDGTRVAVDILTRLMQGYIKDGRPVPNEIIQYVNKWSHL